MNFKFLAILLALLPINAQAGVLLTIPTLSSSEKYPVTERYKRCLPEAECVVVQMRASAPYGHMFEVVLNNRQADTLLRNGGYGKDLPDPINVYRASDATYAHLIGTSEVITPPPPESMPETDKEIGYKLLYCAVTGPAACTGTILRAIIKGADNLVSSIGTCASAVKSCSDFMAAWDKERAYYKALNDYYRSQGIGPSGGNASDGAIAEGQGGQGPGYGGTTEPVFVGCFDHSIGMGGGPAGPWLEEQGTDCYPL